MILHFTYCLACQTAHCPFRLILDKISLTKNSFLKFLGGKTSPTSWKILRLSFNLWTTLQPSHAQNTEPFFHAWGFTGTCFILLPHKLQVKDTRAVLLGCDIGGGAMSGLFSETRTGREQLLLFEEDALELSGNKYRETVPPTNKPLLLLFFSDKKSCPNTDKASLCS